ncbi:MAG TPA: hypothetical protein VJO99_11195 [Burkholderiaceae bacterium]|nr:hypothetical protein [Burkholderiaceae bacterium]
MLCIDDNENPGVLRTAAAAPWRRRLGLVWLGLIAGCSTPTPVSESGAPPAASSRTAPSTSSSTPIAPGRTGSTAQAVKLPPPSPVRSWDEVRRQAAKRLVAANPGITYTGTPPDPLLAIPVLEVELHADGSIRKIDVMRHPRQARETTQIAIDAVRNAAPFGDVSRLPKPWRFTETFLFDDDRKFKPRTLD